MKHERVWLKDHLNECIECEVHVTGWGEGPFFTVREIQGNKVKLSTRYSTRPKHIVDISKCYFTRRFAKKFLLGKRHDSPLERTIN